jgi:hypothetical protein
MTMKAGWAFESGTAEGWIASSGTAPAANATFPRSGTYALRLAEGSTVVSPAIASLSDAIAQICNYQIVRRNGLRFGLLYNGTWVAYVEFNTLGQPTLFYKGGTLSVGPLTEFEYTFGAQHVVELDLTVAASGSVYLRIDGDVLLSAVSVDTRASAGAITQVNQVGATFPSGSGSATCDIDDVLIFDHAGSLNNAWPDGMTGHRRNVTADGTYEEWDASTGVDHYALIDETVPSGADYIQTGTAAEKDSFAMQDVTGMFAGAVDILAFQVVYFAEEPNGPSARTLDPFLRVGGTDYPDNVDHTLTAPMTFYQGKPWETNPDTASLAWTAAALDAIEIGIESGA